MSTFTKRVSSRLTSSLFAKFRSAFWQVMAGTTECLQSRSSPQKGRPAAPSRSRGRGGNCGSQRMTL